MQYADAPLALLDSQQTVLKPSIDSLAYTLFGK